MLLTACRREVPSLARQPRFVIWQNKLLEIQQRNAARHAAFERKTAAIKKLIDSQDGATAPLQTMLLDAAREASTPEEIAQIRELQTLCETLARVRMLEAAQGGVRELQTLSRNLAQLSDLRLKNDFTSYRQLGEKSFALLKNLSVKYQAVPEVTAQIQKLRNQFEQEGAAGRQAEQDFLAEENAFKDILSGRLEEDILRRSKAFLRKYPAGNRAGEVRNLLQELDLLRKPYHKELQLRLDNMQRSTEKSLQFLQNSWQKLMESVLQESRYELALFYTGKTDERSKQHLMRFETWETPQWSQPDSAGMRHLSFSDPGQRQVSVSLNADGKGELLLPEGKFICRLAWGEPEGKLPQAYWQTVLYDLQAIIRHTKPADLPEVILELNALINQERFKLPDELTLKLFDLLRDTVKILQQTPHEFVFQKKVLTFLLKNRPQFAGLVRLNKQNKTEFYPAGRSPQSDMVWRLDAQESDKPFKVLGKMQNSSVKVQNPSLLKDGKIHAAAIPADLNYSQKMAGFRKEAAAQKLKFPDLPDWAKE